MNPLWQNDILSILDANNVNLYDLLLFILRGCLDIHSHHRTILQNKTSDVLDLWSEQFPAESQEWTVRAAVEVYCGEVNRLIQPHAGFQFRGTKANLEQIEGFSMVEMGKKSIPRVCSSNSNDIITTQNSVNNVNLPETWCKTEDLFDFFLDFPVCFR